MSEETKVREECRVVWQGGEGIDLRLIGYTSLVGDLMYTLT